MEKAPKPDHDMAREVVENLMLQDHIDYSTYCILNDYICDCECALDPERCVNNAEE